MPETVTEESKAPRILSTLNEDGSRRWLRPRTSPGRFLLRRRIVAYALIAIFTVIPYISINGKPAILLDIVARQFTFFGKTFLPTDTLLLALLIVTVFLSIFAITALFGRIWCGWACPQTVYMEFVYRPIEFLFQGGPGRKPKIPLPAGMGMVAKYAIYLLISLFLAHVFLAYFVGVDRLAQWVQRSPIEHPTSFLVMAIVTGLMMFDFCFFREQTCIVACPYGRFQSVMLDRNSLIITYDEKRGEPRGRLRRKKKTNDTDVHLKTIAPEQGDCIDCHMCVTTCPTGIDIRNGLQMECIGCAQCIDACDSVMDKIGKDRGLIRYSTEAAVSGEKTQIFRPRPVIYAVVLSVLISVFFTVLSTKADADVTILRGPGLPFTQIDTGEISNGVRFKLTNRTQTDAVYTITPVEPAAMRFVGEDAPVTLALAAGEVGERSVRLAVPRQAFTNGQTTGVFRITDAEGFEKLVHYTLLGPRQAPQRSEDSDDAD